MIAFSIALASLLAVGTSETYQNRIRLEYDEFNKAYVAALSIGTPPQTLNLAFDFNTTVLWVPEVGCPCDAECTTVPESVCYEICVDRCCLKDGNDKDNNTTIEYGADDQKTGRCTQNNLFNPKLSATYFEKKLEIQLPVEGTETNFHLAYDTLHLAPHHKPALNAYNFIFAHTNKLPDSYSNVKYDGVFGLARVGPSGAKPPVQQLAEKRVLAQPIITMSFGQPFASDDAVLALGEIDQSDCAFPVEAFFPLSSKSEWKIITRKLFLNETEKRCNYATYLDPSSPYIHLPPLIYDELKINVDPTTGVHTMQCDDAVSTFGKFYFSFDNAIRYSPDRLYRWIEESVCEVLVRRHNSIILGRPFLERKCIVLDYNGRIGISKYRRFQ